MRKTLDKTKPELVDVRDQKEVGFLARIMGLHKTRVKKCKYCGHHKLFVRKSWTVCSKCKRIQKDD